MNDHSSLPTSYYSERLNRGVVARSGATTQSPEIASLRPVHHAVQGFARNDSLGDVNSLRPFTIVQQSVFKNVIGQIRIALHSHFF